jgi:hypothetical protein
MKYLNVSLLLFLLSEIFILTSKSETLVNELVMVKGSSIEAKTVNGKIKITADDGLSRTYTWDGASRTAQLRPRKNRWYGSFGAYFPGQDFHWDENNGIRRGVMEEGQQHFNSLDEAIAWLKLPYNSDCVYRDDGLVVCYSKNIERFQVNVNVWQIFIEGIKPLIPPESTGDRIWFYDPKEKPEIFQNSQNQTYYLGGKKPIKIPDSCNDCILFTEVSHF